ncbi:hypothetical protein, partial [Bartonella sp. CL27QHWL]|uniref:hypothetical protein n=1 Tax=Bartonella sp. CL27QHWL TaxID=3243521 RepID=UPI0035D0E4BE
NSKLSQLKFEKHSFKNRVPFVIYADFESISEPLLVVSNDDSSSNTNNNTISKKLFKQIASAVGIYVHSDYPQLYTSQYFSCRNSNVVDIFCNFLIKMEEQFSNLLNSNSPLIMTDEDWKRYQLETHCYYCNQLLGYDKVKDHDHYNGKYRGASHNSCNLNEKKAMFVPVFFHNLSNYDSHLFIKELMTKLPENKNLKLLAKSPEEYISFQFGCFKFLDSYRFLQSSLDNITKSMTDDDFKITRFSFTEEEDFKLLRKKGSVPYSFYKSHESYNITYLEKSMFF